MSASKKEIASEAKFEDHECDIWVASLEGRDPWQFVIDATLRIGLKESDFEFSRLQRQANGTWCGHVRLIFAERRNHTKLRLAMDGAWVGSRPVRAVRAKHRLQEGQGFIDRYERGEVPVERPKPRLLDTEPECKRCAEFACENAKLRDELAYAYELHRQQVAEIVERHRQQMEVVKRNVSDRTKSTPSLNTPAKAPFRPIGRGRIFFDGVSWSLMTSSTLSQASTISTSCLARNSDFDDASANASESDGSTIVGTVARSPRTEARSPSTVARSPSPAARSSSAESEQQREGVAASEAGGSETISNATPQAEQAQPSPANRMTIAARIELAERKARAKE